MMRVTMVLCGLLVASPGLAVGEYGGEREATRALVVRFRTEVPNAVARELLARHGAVDSRPLLPQGNRRQGMEYRWWSARFPVSADTNRIAAALRIHPSIEAVEAEQDFDAQPAGQR